MSTTTAKLGLTKPAQGEQYNVDIFNGNSDLIDTAVGNLQSDHTNSGGPVTLAFTAGLSTAIAHGLGRIPKAVTLTQAAGGAFTALILALDTANLTATNFQIRAKIATTNADFVGNATLVWTAF